MRFSPVWTSVLENYFIISILTENMVDPAIFGLATAALLIHIWLIVSLLLFALKKTILPDIYSRVHLDKVYSKVSRYRLELAWIFAALATSGSLYMSEILEWTPCPMCWIQRGFIYPLVIILGIAIYIQRKNLSGYSLGIFEMNFDFRDLALTAAMICVPISFYHSIYQRYDQYISAGCSPTAISCSTEYTFHFNYITVPVLAFTAVLVIVLLLWRFNSTDY